MFTSNTSNRMSSANGQRFPPRHSFFQQQTSKITEMDAAIKNIISVLEKHNARLNVLEKNNTITTKENTEKDTEKNSVSKPNINNIINDLNDIKTNIASTNKLIEEIKPLVEKLDDEKTRKVFDEIYVNVSSSEINLNKQIETLSEIQTNEDIKYVHFE